MIRRSVRWLGAVVALIGLWGAAVPFVGPLFGFPMPAGGHVAPFTWSASHVELHLLPGLGAMVGGLLLLAARRRGFAIVGSALAVLGGAWFVLAPSASRAWLPAGGMGTATGGMSGPAGMAGMGASHPSVVLQVITPLGYHYLTGVLIVCLASVAYGVLVSVAGRIDLRERAPDPVAARPARGPAADRERLSAR